MLLIYGNKQYVKKIGFVADHCPACESTRVFRINRLGLTAHIFWLPVSSGNLLGYNVVCQACKSDFPGEPTNYKSIMRRNKGELEDLVEATNPKLGAGNAGEVAAFERFNSIREPFLVRSEALQARYASGTKLDMKSGLSFAATLVLFLALTIPDYTFLSQANQGHVRALAGFVIVFGLIASFVVLYREPRRFFRSSVEPGLIVSLRSLNPQLHELENCISVLKKYDHKISKFVKAEDLLDEISALA